MIVWKPVPGADYIVSSAGQVRRKNSTDELKPFTYRGYLYVSFRRNGRSSSASVHSLMGAAFFGPRLPHQQIRHLDGDRSNNRIENLKYGSAKENAADRERHGKTRRGAANGNAKLSDQAVPRIIALYRAGKANQYELAVRFGISQAQIWNIVHGKQRQRHPDLSTDIVGSLPT